MQPSSSLQTSIAGKFLPKTITHIKGSLLLLIIGLICCAAIAVGCTTGKEQMESPKPEWVFKPGMTGKTGGVGVSGPHVQGVNAQRNLAINRAVEEIARQMGVRVQNISEIKSTGTRDRSTTQQQSYSIHTVDGQTITAEIREIWHNIKNDNLYVWMVVK